MDSARVESLGLAPLQRELQRDRRAQVDAAAARRRSRTSRALGVAGSVRRRRRRRIRSTRTVNIVQVEPVRARPARPRLLPAQTIRRSRATRAAYVAYITRLLTLAEQPDPAGAAGRIIALETAIATPQWDRARSRDRNATLQQDDGRRARGARRRRTTGTRTSRRPARRRRRTSSCASPTTCKALDTIIIANTPASTWREYLTVQAARQLRRRAAVGVRAGALRVPRQDALRPAGDARRAGSAPSTTSKASLGEAAGQAVRRAATSSPRRRRAWTRW